MARTRGGTARKTADDMQLPDDATDEERREAGNRLRERIYATFTALAVLVALSSHAHAPDALTVLWTLIVSVCGVLLAGLASDLVAHMIVHNTLPSAREFRQIVAVAGRALGVIGLPAIVLVLAALGIIDVDLAVTIATVSLIVALAVIALIAVAHTGLSFWKRVIVLAGIVALGVAVLLVEQLVH
jgi:fatty acid desaturase